MTHNAIYDFAYCVGIDELKKVIHLINESRWKIISMTQHQEEYTILFRRPAGA